MVCETLLNFKYNVSVGATFNIISMWLWLKSMRQKKTNIMYANVVHWFVKFGNDYSVREYCVSSVCVRSRQVRLMCK